MQTTTLPDAAVVPVAGGAMMEAPLSEEDKQTRRDMEERRIQALDNIGVSLEGLKDAAVTWRVDVEDEWTRSYNQYNTANQYITEAKEQRGPRSANTNATDDDAYRRTSDNITRSKVVITASRLGDMLFPTNDANWSLEASPKPDVPDDLLPAREQPQPQKDPQTGEMMEAEPLPERTPAEVSELKGKIAAERAGNMRITVEDQLEECNYAEQGRMAIFDSCLYGSGVVRGPITKSRKKYSWNQGGKARNVEEKTIPVAERVDLWSFFPQPCRSMKECEHVFQLHLLPRTGVRGLAQQPGFDPKQIQRLLDMMPTHGALATIAANRGHLRPDAHMVLKDRYSVWEFTGPMPKEGIQAFISGLLEQELMSVEEAAILAMEIANDPMTEIMCDVWVSQGIVIKVALAMLDDCGTGYNVFCYEDDPTSVFGHGVPYLCADDQLAANQLWHAIMLNSMMSAGPQIGVRAGMIAPMSENGVTQRNVSLTATKPRTWAMNDEVTDIKQALSVFIIPNVTDKMMAVYERTKTNADEHTMIPLVMQGDATNSALTSSGMAMLMNAANVIMRRLAKTWDDRITIPLIGAFYDYNMLYNDDESIKGDYCVVPKGASHLLVKDVQAQHIQFATQMFSSNPLLQPYMKPEQFAIKNIEMLDLSVNEMLFTQAQVEENARKAGEQPNPEVMKAQAQATHAEASKSKAETEAAMAKDKMEFDRWERELAHTERMADIEARERIQQMQTEAQRLSLAQSMAALESDERIQMERIIADLQKHAGSLDVKQYAIDATTRLGAEKVAQADTKLQAEIAVESPGVKIQ